MADQLFDDYGVGTGSPNLFGGRMSEQELNQLLGQFTPRTSIAEGLMADGTADRVETADRVDIGGRFPYIPYEKEPEGLIRILNQNTGRYELKKDPNFIPYNSPEYWAMMQANADQVAANGISQTQPQTLSGGMKTDDPTFALDQTQPSAPTSVMGMFPEVEAMQRALYQQKQNEAMQAQAMQFARLTPFEKASYGLAMGGQQLGGAIGSALGGKDPQLQQISMRNAIMKKLDPSNPAQQMKVAQEIAQYDPEFAMSIADNARKSAIQIRQASSAARQGTTEKLQILDRLNQVNDALQTISPDAPEYKTLLNNKSLLESQLKKAENTPDKIQIAERIAINKGFTQGSEDFNKEVAKQLERPEKDTQIEKLQSYRDQLINSKAPASKVAEVEAVIKSLGEGTAPKIILPGERIEPKDYLRFNEYIDKTPTMTRTSSILSDAPTAIETIRMSTKNNFSSASLPAAIAKITGEGKSMSNQDIERYTSTGGLDERIAGDVVGFFTGKKTDITKAQAEQYAISLYRGALIERKKFIQDQAEQLGYDKSPNYETTIKQLDKKLEQFKLIKPSNQTRESLPKATKEVDAEKEKRYQQYKQDRLGEGK